MVSLTFLGGGACVGGPGWLAGKAGGDAGRAVCGAAPAEAGLCSIPLISSPSCSINTRAGLIVVAAVLAGSAQR